MVYALLMNIVSQTQEQFVPVPFKEDKPIFVQPIYIEQTQKEFKTLEFSKIVFIDLKEVDVAPVPSNPT